MSKNANLHEAKKKANDEWYTKKRVYRSRNQVLLESF